MRNSLIREPNSFHATGSTSHQTRTDRSQVRYHQMGAGLLLAQAAIIAALVKLLAN
jgi:hypothetical protein